MPGNNDSDDFFEEDEPVAEVAAAFDAGEKGLTSPRTASRQLEPGDSFWTTLVLNPSWNSEQAEPVFQG